MSVMFKTQQGRTLVNNEMDVADMTRALGSLVEVCGVEVVTCGPAGQEPLDQTVFHVSTRHVVEWW